MFSCFKNTRTLWKKTGKYFFIGLIQVFTLAASMKKIRLACGNAFQRSMEQIFSKRKLHYLDI